MSSYDGRSRRGACSKKLFAQRKKNPKKGDKIAGGKYMIPKRAFSEWGTKEMWEHEQTQTLVKRRTIERDLRLENPR